MFLFALLFLLTVNAKAQTLEQKAIAFAKGISPLALDSTLPQGLFSDWLARIVGDSAAVQWELNDCGEQTGDPAIDKDRDIPMCVGVTVILSDHRTLGIMLLVGTDKKGFVSDPAVFDIYLESAGKARTVRRLSELKKAVKGEE